MTLTLSFCFSFRVDGHLVNSAATATTACRQCFYCCFVWVLPTIEPRRLCCRVEQHPDQFHDCEHPRAITARQGRALRHHQGRLFGLPQIFCGDRVDLALVKLGWQPVRHARPSTRISFITFQQIMFVVDQAEGRDQEPDPVRYLFFVLFFPHLVAGPLVPHRRLCAQIDRKPFLRPSPQFLKVGSAYFAIGLTKKLLIAEPLLTVNNDLFRATAELSGLEAWFNAIIYSFRIYFDFSAYSDMATGLAYLFGIQFPRNFNSPYKASNIFEFWRRWHITLYKFFREYVFVRLLARPFMRRRVWIPILVVLTFSAMWHGVGWGYMLWGWGHAGLMIGARSWRKLGALRVGSRSSPLRHWASISVTLLLVTVLWLPFAINNPKSLLLYSSRLVDMSFHSAHIESWMWVFLVVPAVITFAMPNSHQICFGGRRRGWLLPLATVLFALAAPLALGRQAPPPPFIYFQF